MSERCLIYIEVCQLLRHIHHDFATINWEQ